MEFDFQTLEVAKRYKLLAGLVVPRPIALVSTRDASGVVNVAPYSFFNALGDDPPICIISVENRDEGPLKDTARNILDTREFVVNLVDESIAEPMHACSAAYPPDTSELDQAGFTAAPSHRVGPPRVAESPVSLECRLHTHIPISLRHLLIGEIVWMHVRDGILDPASLRVVPDQYLPVGRFFGNRYCRTRDQFEIAPNEYNLRRAALGKG
ncbi:MAG: flavin reductase family protein [Burkholderiales bacterium]